MRRFFIIALMLAAPEAGAEGIHVDSLRLSAAGLLIDARLRVTDPAQAAPLFGPGSHPQLLLPDGQRLEVAAPAKVGPLKALAGHPEAGRSYFILFGNPGRRIAAGQQVDLVVGGTSLGRFTVEE